MSRPIRLAVLVVVMAPASNAFGQHLPVTNSSGRALTLWVLRGSPPAWERPIFVPDRSVRTLDLSVPGKYYLVVRGYGREFYMGWHDIHGLIQKEPDLELDLVVAMATPMRIIYYRCPYCGQYHAYLPPPEPHLRLNWKTKDGRILPQPTF